jgi:hypothetical protein
LVEIGNGPAIYRWILASSEVSTGSGSDRVATSIGRAMNELPDLDDD